MKRVQWSSAARRDIFRLYDFLRDVNPRAAARIIQRLTEATRNLTAFPEQGRPVDNYVSQDVRSLIVGDYEIRYEVEDHRIYIVRIWHGREDR
ncbi:type II toxin-antitoxin system RelE/ParE family toxin [Asticcacaulis sp. AC460]|uniref:type II toxin-antitoxin system RelE/ParE family toxin n=1 Tax=Asticcacaulis sp. AC460 TaxID=1282360 RepID=UPI0009DE4EA1|nr:type II toxin-antitoxin system RelE/ParE family toxin [Asticcacaulis sp. AC460]